MTSYFIYLYTTLSLIIFCYHHSISAELITSHQLNAKFGVRTILSRTDLQLDPSERADSCTVKVISSETNHGSSVGCLLPTTFPCDFETGSVYYEHYGLPHYTESSVLLTVTYVNDDSERITQPVTLNVNVSSAISSEQIVTRNTGLSVPTFNGYSDRISSSNLGFTYNKENEDCVISVLNGAHSWPR